MNIYQTYLSLKELLKHNCQGIPLKASLKGKDQVARVSKMKNRFNMPSSAVSMPSLASMEPSKETNAPDNNDDDMTGSYVGVARGHPALEKSASSASIVRNRDGRVNRLGSVSERTGAGSSADSVNDADPSYIKKKKDQVRVILSG